MEQFVGYCKPAIKPSRKGYSFTSGLLAGLPVSITLSLGSTGRPQPGQQSEQALSETSLHCLTQFKHLYTDKMTVSMLAPRLLIPVRGTHLNPFFTNDWGRAIPTRVGNTLVGNILIPIPIHDGKFPTDELASFRSPTHATRQTLA